MSKIKKQPDINGFYWVKREGIWHIVEVRGSVVYWAGSTGYNNIHISNEWIGPLVPDMVTVYKTTTEV